MTAIDSASTQGSLPRPLLFIGVPLLAIALTLLFAVARFPYERLREPLAQQVRDATGITLTIGSLGPYVSLFGPGLVVRDTLALLFLTRNWRKWICFDFNEHL